MRRPTAAMWMACLAVAGLMFATTEANAQRRGGGQRGGDGAARGGQESSASEDGTKKYDEVITDKAETKVGLFKVHKVGDKLYYEIPREQLGKDMLWVTSIEQTVSGSSYAGMDVSDRVMRWELRESDNTVLLRDVRYNIRAREGDEYITSAVEASNLAPIIMTFSLAAWGADKAPVIDVTNLFKSDVSEISAASALGAGAMDAGKTFLDSVKAFPQNIETNVLVTYRPGGGGAAAGGRGGRGGAGGNVTAMIHHSMLKLPEDKMTPREMDDRVGFFGVSFEDYGTSEYHEVDDVRYIARWRLEKKDPSAEVSEPVKPIVFYVSREVPDKWKPYVQKGIEMWQPAFEAAGFKNAIIGKQAPSPQEDPDWDPEDARISSIRWLPSTTENAFGPHVSDPRTGEILEADVRIYHNVLKLARDWYFVQASPNDERAQQLPMPDELVGELLAYVVAHEVGHSLGFPHNMKASSSYSVEQLRDKEFTAKNGTEASIMDYGRFNYVAQPGDEATLIPKIGPYDFFAIKWGYSQYEDEEAEAKGQRELLAMQIDNPMLRFGNPNSIDPSRQTEDLGSDPTAATELGLKNLDRVMGYLVKACCKENDDYDQLSNMYNQVLAQRNRELNHVLGSVGGFEEIQLFFGDAEAVYHHINGKRQKDAVAFLNKNAFQVPQSLIPEEVTLRLEPTGTADRILGAQRGILSSLISDGRVKRMSEHAERMKGKTSADDPLYTAADMLADVRGGIWSELDANVVEVDLYRRNLQRAHVDLLATYVKQDNPSSDLPALCRAELEVLKSTIEGKVDSADDLTQAHLHQVLATITRALDPKVVEPAAAAAPTQTFPGRRGGMFHEVRR